MTLLSCQPACQPVRAPGGGKRAVKWTQILPSGPFDTLQAWGCVCERLRSRTRGQPLRSEKTPLLLPACLLRPPSAQAAGCARRSDRPCALTASAVSGAVAAHQQSTGQRRVLSAGPKVVRLAADWMAASLGAQSPPGCCRCCPPSAGPERLARGWGVKG